ncbi:ImuA family protein [Chitinophaga parva]|uniref:ImuA family protein n=1 Tax=Chitinophaga parva TaxID=2169414 RepID=UPI00196B96D3|nr:Error-prone repair protein ImuA [Chitinophaga parva]
MGGAKLDIINQLRKEILLMEGHKPVVRPEGDHSLGPLAGAFPDGGLPVGVHEFISMETEAAAATVGFVAGLLSHLLQQGGVCLWISAARTLFPPALLGFNIQPDKVIFIDLLYDKDVLWAMEEALKCGGLGAVVGEMREISFTASRRLQLAIEQSGIMGFVLRHRPRNLNPIASLSRWEVRPLPSIVEPGLPGIGHACFSVQLLKLRHGQPAHWELEWCEGMFKARIPWQERMPAPVHHNHNITPHVA